MRIWIAIRMTLALTLLTGIIYPLAMTAIAQLVFPYQANGSLLTRDGKVIGSELIGQKFASDRYFHGRPSAAGDKGYDATASGGSNLGPTNKTLIDNLKTRVKDLREAEPGAPAALPVDIVTTSGSGLDPDISPAAADLQIARIARARGLSQEQVSTLVQSHTRERWAGVLGEPGVNVLDLNLALDDLAGGAKVSSNR